MSTVIDFGLSDDERLLDESARRFADEQLRPAERRHEAARGYPDTVHARYRALGFATMSLPESAGGGGLPLAIAARVWERLAAADPAAPFGLGVPGIAALSRSRRGAVLARSRQLGAIVVSPSDALALEIAWVPCARPAWLAIISSDGVALMTDLIV